MPIIDVGGCETRVFIIDNQALRAKNLRRPAPQQRGLRVVHQHQIQAVYLVHRYAQRHRHRQRYLFLLIPPQKMAN